MLKIRTTLTNTRAAIDLASIMVGIIVIGIIGGVIAATVFAVIPWAQNNAAKSKLDSIVTAQSAYQGFKEGNGFASKEELLNPGAVAGNKPLLGSDDSNVAVGANGKCFIAVSKSDTGKYYYISDKNHTPQEAGATGVTSPNCPGVTVEALVESIESGEEPVVAARFTTQQTYVVDGNIITGPFPQRTFSANPGSPSLSSVSIYSGDGDCYSAAGAFDAAHTAVLDKVKTVVPATYDEESGVWPQMIMNYDQLSNTVNNRIVSATLVDAFGTSHNVTGTALEASYVQIISVDDPTGPTYTPTCMQTTLYVTGITGNENQAGGLSNILGGGQATVVIRVSATETQTISIDIPAPVS